MEDDDECKLNESFCCYTAAIVTYICLSKHLCVCVCGVIICHLSQFIQWDNFETSSTFRDSVITQLNQDICETVMVKGTMCHCIQFNFCNFYQVM